jgi:hypothetical protein
MTDELPNGVQNAEVSRTRESAGTPDGPLISAVLRDEFTAKRYSPWVSLLTGLAVTTTVVGLSSVLGLQAHLPAVLLGIVCGLALYESIRLMVVRSGWARLRTPVARSLVEAIGFRPGAIESSDPPVPRSRP